MKRVVLFLLVLSFLFAGCAQTVQTSLLYSTKAIGEDMFDAYLYRAGIAGNLRFAFLKVPDARVEVVAESLQFTKATIKFSDAMAFMKVSSYGLKRVDVQEVRYGGQVIGFLLTHRLHSFARVHIEPVLYERNGTIHLDVRESPFSEEL